MSMIQPKIQRITFYIDGFNFYYGLRENQWKRFYWLDMVSFCSKFLKQHHELVMVKYFSAVPQNHDGKQRRQAAFFEANKQNPKFSLYLGSYNKKRIRCNATCKEPFEMYSEKQTDINIAVEIFRDIINNDTDIVCLVSGDGDLVPVVKFIFTTHNISQRVFVFTPPKRFLNELKTNCDAFFNLERYESYFEKSLLPATVNQQNGTPIHCPQKWNNGHVK